MLAPRRFHTDFSGHGVKATCPGTPVAGSPASACPWQHAPAHSRAERLQRQEPQHLHPSSSSPVHHRLPPRLTESRIPRVYLAQHRGTRRGRRWSQPRSSRGAHTRDVVLPRSLLRTNAARALPALLRLPLRAPLAAGALPSTSRTGAAPKQTQQLFGAGEGLRLRTAPALRMLRTGTQLSPGGKPALGSRCGARPRQPAPETPSANANGKPSPANCHPSQNHRITE